MDRVQTAGLAIILFEAHPQSSGLRSHNWIAGGVKVRLTVEYLESQQVLFDLLRLTAQSFADNKSQEPAMAGSVAEHIGR